MTVPGPGRSTPDPEPLAWRHRLAPWACPDDRRAARQLAVTAVLYVAAWVLLAGTWAYAKWLAPLAALPVAAITVRLFVIAHDCGHGSYLSSRRARDIVAFWIGVAAITPHRWWRRCHAAHHAHAGKLERRVGGDVPLWTVEEYRARSAPRRALYRFVRNPAGLLGAMTFVHFALVHRCPLGTPARWRAEWASVWATNAVLGLVGVAAWSAGVLADYLVLHALTMYWACALAGWLTHSQHQYEHAYWRTAPHWCFSEFGLRGSTWLKLPRWLAWISADIGVHHVHHLAPCVPNYRLNDAAHAFPELAGVRTIGWRETFGAYRYALWDGACARLVTFAEVSTTADRAARRPPSR